MSIKNLFYCNRLIDGDSVYTSSTLGSRMSRGRKACSRDSDCNVIDCKGKCQNNLCSPLTTSTNYQIFCQKVSVYH